MAKTRKPLEDWQVEDAARLKDLFEKRCGMSQEQFGASFGLGGQGMVWQYLNGHAPLNLPAAIKFAKGLGCCIQEFSPTIAKMVLEAAALVVVPAFPELRTPDRGVDTSDPPTDAARVPFGPQRRKSNRRNLM